MLNKLHLNHHTLKAELYSLLECTGLNYPSFQFHQDQKGLLTLLKHLWWDGTMGNDILVVLSAIQLISVLCKPILEDVNIDTSYLGISWILHLRNRLYAMNGKMWVENQWTSPIQHLHDQSHMKAFSNIAGITIGKLYKTNHCRMYMECITISDLANERG